MMGMSLIKDESTVVTSNAKGVSVDIANVVVLVVGLSRFKGRSTTVLGINPGRATTRALRGSGVKEHPLSRRASERCPSLLPLGLDEWHMGNDSGMPYA